MAWQIPQSVTTNGVPAVNLLTTDDAFIGADVLVASIGDHTVLGTGSGHEVLVYGTVASANQGAIVLGDSILDTTHSVAVKAGGHVQNVGTGGICIALLGNNSTVTNAGLISSTAGDGVLLSDGFTTSTLRIVNSGTIEAGSDAIRNEASGTFVVVNSGRIVGGDRSFEGLFALNAARITNTGTMVGDIALGPGNDLYSGANGRLTGKVFGNDGADTITGGIAANEFQGGDQNDTLKGNGGADRLFGQNEADTLDGGLGNDTLNGGAQNDVLIGGIGKDLLTGGTGSDIFRYTSKTHSPVGANADRILDFDDGGAGDRIDLSALFGPAMVYRHAAAFTATGQVRINDVAGADVIVEVNTGGSLAADFTIRLVGTTLSSMNAGDFVL